MSKCYFIGTTWGSTVISSYFRTIADRLAARGHRVVLIINHSSPEIYQDSPDTNPTVLTWPSRKARTLADARFLQGLIRRYQPDCVIGSFASVNLMMLAGWLMRVPVRVFWYHTLFDTWQVKNDGGWRETLNKTKLRLNTRLATDLAINSTATWHEAQTVFGVPEHKLHLVRYAVPDPLARDDLRAVEVDPHKLFYVGRMEKQKGFDTLLRAFALIQQTHPETHLEAIGGGPELAGYRRLAETLGIGEKVAFLGPKVNHQVMRHQRSAAISYVPSRSEAFGIVCVEGLANEKIVIASHTGGIPDIIRDGVDGFLVPVDDPEAIAAVTRRVLDDPALYRTISTNARARYEDAFDYERTLETVVDWLEQV